MKECASVHEIESEIRKFLISHGVKVANFHPLVSPNLRVELGDFSTDAPLRMLKAGLKGAEQGQAVAELVRRLEAVGCELVKEAEASPGGAGGFGYLNFRLSTLGAQVARILPGNDGSVVFRIIIVPPTAGLESRVKAAHQEQEAPSKVGAGVRAGCKGAPYLRTVARGLVQALLLRRQYPGVTVELFLGEQQISVDGLDAKEAGKILFALAQDERRELQGLSQERALAVLEAQIQAGTQVETHVWLSANSFLPELFKGFFGQHGSWARFHFSATSWDDAAGVAEIPQELLEVGRERPGDAVELGVGLLWCLASDRVASEFDWYAGALAEWDNLVWATQVIRRRLEKQLGGQELEMRGYALPKQEELRAVLLRSLTMSMWLERAALLGEVESFMVVWRDWLNKANRFLNQPATGTLPNEWRDILPSLKAGLSVTMRLL